MSSSDTVMVPREAEVVWVVTASQGEYSDRSEWAVEVHDTEEAGKAAVERLEEDLQEGRIKDFAVSKDVACILAALRSPDPEVERLRGDLSACREAVHPLLQHGEDNVWRRAKIVVGLADRAALSSNSGGR